MSGGGRDSADAEATTRSQTVGSLLVDIATSLNEGLRMLRFSDKRQWGPDEFDQVRALEIALDQAKRDFQTMAPLVNGQSYYENDRRPDSLAELRALGTRFAAHVQKLKDWLRTGGPINPAWSRDTALLQHDLHRAQCRAACRIFAAAQEETRCLGAFQVHRQRRRLEAERARRRRAREQRPTWARRDDDEDDADAEADGEKMDDELEALVPSCNAVGNFERLGDDDVAFLCDFCDGSIVWKDLDGMPSVRKSVPGNGIGGGGNGRTGGYPHWQAEGSSRRTIGPKTVVFAPLAIANHLPPEPGCWEAGILCPYCEQYTYFDQGEDSEDEVRWNQDEKGFPTLRAFQEHLEWAHTAMGVPALLSSASKCSIM